MFKNVTSLVRGMQGDGVRSRKFEIRRSLEESSSAEHDTTRTKMNVAANFFGDWRRAGEFFQELNDTFRAGNCDGLRKLLSILDEFFKQDGVIDYDALERKNVFAILSELLENEEMRLPALQALDSALVSNIRVGEFMMEKGLVEKMIAYMHEMLSSDVANLEIVNVMMNVLRNMSTEKEMLQQLYDCHLLELVIRILREDLAASSCSVLVGRINETAVCIIESFLCSSIPNTQELNDALMAVAHCLDVATDEFSSFDTGHLIQRATYLFDSLVRQDPSAVYRLAGLSVGSTPFFEHIDNLVCQYIETSRETVISAVNLIANALWSMDVERPIPSLLSINIDRYYELLVDQQALLGEEDTDDFFRSVLTVVNNYTVNTQKTPSCMTSASLIVLIKAVCDDAELGLKLHLVRIVSNFLEYGGLQTLIESGEIPEFVDLLSFIVDIQSTRGISGKQETQDTLLLIKTSLEMMGRHCDIEQYNALFESSIHSFLQDCLLVNETVGAMAQSLLDTYYR